MANEVIIITDHPGNLSEATIVEIIQTDANSNLAEEIIEAFLDANDQDSVTEYGTMAFEQPTLSDIAVSEDALQAAYEQSTGVDYLAADTSFASYSSVSDVTPGSTLTDSTAQTDADATAAAAQQQAYTDAAQAAQAEADNAIAVGDYETASHLRETAEQQAWQAGDSSVLHGSDSTDLTNSAWQQDQAQYYEQQQTIYAQQSNYEAAQESSANAAWHQGNADWNAGGSDHTGQAKAEEYEMSLAVGEENTAAYHASNADWYAGNGQWRYRFERSASRRRSSSTGRLARRDGRTWQRAGRV